MCELWINNSYYERNLSLREWHADQGDLRGDMTSPSAMDFISSQELIWEVNDFSLG